MVVVLRKDIRRFMMTDRIMPRAWMYRRRWTPTVGLIRRQCTAQERLANMRRWKCQLSILTLVRATHALIIGNSQSNKEVHKETSTLRRSVWGFGYPCASSTHGTRVYSNIRTFQRVVIHLVARVLNMGFWFSKNTRISHNTTYITNRQELLTP